MWVQTKPLKSFVRASKLKSPLVLNSFWANLISLQYRNNTLTLQVTDHYSWLVSRVRGDSTENESWEVVLVKTELDKLLRQWAGDTLELKGIKEGLVCRNESVEVLIPQVDTGGQAVPRPAPRQLTFDIPRVDDLVEGLKFVQSFMAPQGLDGWACTTYYPQGVLLGGGLSSVGLVEGLGEIPESLSFREENIQSFKNLPRSLAGSCREGRLQLEYSDQDQTLELMSPLEYRRFALTPDFVAAPDESWVFDRKSLLYNLQLALISGMDVFWLDIRDAGWVFYVPKKHTRASIEPLSSNGLEHDLCVSGDILLNGLRKLSGQTVEIRIGKGQMQLRETTEEGLRCSVILPLNVR